MNIKKYFFITLLALIPMHTYCMAHLIGRFAKNMIYIMGHNQVERRIKRPIKKYIAFGLATGGVTSYFATKALQKGRPSIKKLQKNNVSFVIDCIAEHKQEVIGSQSMEHVIASLKRNFFGQTKLLYHKNKPVGFISFEKLSDNEGIVYMIGVPEKLQGKGYGTQLMNHAVQELFKEGCTHIILHTIKPNAKAVQFYEKMGFTIIGETSTQFKMHIKKQEFTAS